MIDNIYLCAHLHSPSDYIFIFISCAALCLRTCAHLYSSSNKLILILIHTFIHAQLCVYGLAHTCTPLLINLFYLARLCVNGLVHTCAPLQINKLLIDIEFMCGFVFTDLRTLALLF